MPAGKVVSLKVTPSQSAMLCFDTDGIIGQPDAQLDQSVVQLGQHVTRFDFTTFYAKLGSTVTGNPALLAYDSQGITTDSAVRASTLMALRAEPRKALLDKAVGARENAFYQKYANQTAIIARQRLYYDPSKPNSKPTRLARLSTIAQNQANALNAAYTADKRLGVVKHTRSDLSSTAQSSGSSGTGSLTWDTAGSTGTNIQNTDNINDPTHWIDSRSSGRDINGNLTPSGTTNESTEKIFTPTVTTNVTGSTQETGFIMGGSTSTGNVTLQQGIVNTDYGYRVPSLESDAQNQRAQISLIDEQFTQFMFGQDLPYLETVFANELQGIDLDVKRLQVAYLNTILMSPVCGVVTGIFKQPGEGVKAGEPVIRVEDTMPVLLVGTLIYRGMISLGATVTITTTLFSQPPGTARTVITGTIVAAQGHSSEDDWWDVVISYDNADDSSEPILPLHYHFDFEDTSIVIS